MKKKRNVQTQFTFNNFAASIEPQVEPPVFLFFKLLLIRFVNKPSIENGWQILSKKLKNYFCTCFDKKVINFTFSDD